MNNVIFLGSIISIILLVINLKIFIILKKKFYLKYINKDFQVDSFDYLQDFDGNWIFKDIKLDITRKKFDNNIEFYKEIILIKRILIVNLILTFTFIALSILFLPQRSVTP